MRPFLIWYKCATDNPPIICLFSMPCWTSIKHSIGHSIGYIDFKSAFDYVNRHALLFKLLSKGFTGKIFTVLRTIFGQTKSRVKWSSKVGELFDNMCGALQGGTISPALFNTYVDDMQHYFENEPGIEIGGLRLNHLLQADDLVLMSRTGTGLQRLLDKLAKYCHRWHLILNVIKTKNNGLQ